MGANEETSPLNQPTSPPEQWQQVPPEEWQQYPSYQGPYGAYPSMPGFQPQYGPPSFIPVGYMPPPASFIPPQPILQRRSDRSGSQWSFFIGSMLGLFFPIFSIAFVCCHDKLRFKHGLAVGHALHFAVNCIACVAMVTLFSSVFLPETCNNVNSCVADVMGGTNTQYWKDFSYSCNSTICHIPDKGYVPPQSYSCATCTCDNMKQTCDFLQSSNTTLWVSLFLSLFLLVVSVRVSKYYRRTIAQESMSVYRL